MLIPNHEAPRVEQLEALFRFESAWDRAVDLAGISGTTRAVHPLHIFTASRERLLSMAKDLDEWSDSFQAAKACPSCGGGRCRTYRIASDKAWQGHVPLAADLEGKYHDECDDCGYQSEIRSKP